MRGGKFIKSLLTTVALTMIFSASAKFLMKMSSQDNGKQSPVHTDGQVTAEQETGFAETAAADVMPDKSTFLIKKEDDTPVISFTQSEEERLALSYRYSQFSEKDKEIYRELASAVRQHLSEYTLQGQYTSDDIFRVREEMDLLDEYCMIVRASMLSVRTIDDTAESIQISYECSKADADNLYQKFVEKISDSHITEYQFLYNF